jgi:hypothetical protein
MTTITGPHLIRINAVKKDGSNYTHSGVPIVKPFYTRMISSLDDLSEGEKEDLFLQYLKLRGLIGDEIVVENHNSFDEVYLMEQIIERICSVKGIRKSNLVTKSREGVCAYIRQLCMFVIRKKTTITLKKIGNRFNRDHTTVIHSMETIENYLFSDEKIRDEVYFFLHLNYLEVDEQLKIAS